MLSISVINERQNENFDHASGPIEFGRGAPGSLPRLIVNDGFVSRDHLQVEEVPGGRARLKNISTRNQVTLADGRVLQAGDQCDLDLPLRVTVGETWIDIRAKVAEPGPSRPVAPPPHPAGASPDVTETQLPAAQIAEMKAEGYKTLRPVRKDDQLR